VLSQDFSLNVALPCRISVYEEGGRVMIGMVRPAAMLRMLSNRRELKAIAEEVEATMIKIIDAAK
jgi:uncharacterized protein (DUF302 family)